MKKSLFLFVSLPIVLGIFTGTFLAKNNIGWTQKIYYDETGKRYQIKVGEEFGKSDKKSGRDTAIGLLMASDNIKKGTHKLTRGSEALNVYFTSSTLDLNQFIGYGVQIWGETFQRKDVGWYMDVVKIKILK